MTASNSSSDMLNSIRSRRMPATATTPSIRPQRSTAVVDDALAPGHGAHVLGHGHGLAPGGLDLLDHGLGHFAGGVLARQPTPMSATTTLAPSAAHAKAHARPMPPPAPVMTTTLFSRYPATSPCTPVSSVSPEI